MRRTGVGEDDDAEVATRVNAQTLPQGEDTGVRELLDGVSVLRQSQCNGYLEVVQLRLQTGGDLVR